MRHSDINLTMSKYTHTLRGQEHEAIAKLPDLSMPNFQSQKATGTDGKRLDVESDLACFLAFSGAGPCTPMQTGAEVTPNDAIESPDSTTPGRTRTCDLRIRNPLLYPTELRALQS